MVRVFFSIAEKTEKEKKKSIAKYVICVIVECSIKNQITDVSVKIYLSREDSHFCKR